MPIDPWIARGGAPVDITNTLAQIAALRQRDQAVAADENRNKLYERRLDQADQERAAVRATAEEQKQAEHLLAKAQWALRSPNPRLAVLGDPNIDPKAHDEFFRMSDEQAKAKLQQAEALYSAQLGKGPPAAPPEIKLQDLGGGVRAVTEDGKIQGSPQWPNQPQQYAPQLERRVQKLPGGMEQEYTFDQRSGRKSNFSQPYKASNEGKPTLINTPFGETYRYDETTGTRIPVPTQGEAPAGAAAKPTNAGEVKKSRSGVSMVWDETAQNPTTPKVKGAWVPAK